VLRDDELAAYRREGFHRGARVGSVRDMDRVRERVDACLAEPVVAERPDVHRHLDNRTVYDLCAHPEIVERVASILGPDLLVWHSRVFHKRDDDAPIPWHQDGVYWNLEPLVSVSAWIAIDRAERGNACVEVIPGSHRERLPHTRASTAGRFGHQADPDHVDASTAVAMELEPGEFFLFDTWVLHSSPANTSGRRRTALSVRYTTPDVTVAVEKMSPSVPGYGVQLVRGQTRGTRNPLVPPPAQLSDV
jgi:ectoine hydroxylase-related dioxygenase (phytanoyl-CoA dioxygenase family)